MTSTNENIEINCLLEAIYQKYGYDFRNYSRASIKRRLKLKSYQLNLPNFSYLQHRILYDKKCFDSLLLDLTVNVTEMFRDPSFYKAMREEVIPILKTYPHIKIWHAGCSTGEEVYSMAILLQEEGLLKRSLIYATDINEEVLARAKEGIFPMDRMQEYTQNYQKAGGKKSFADYYTASYDAVIMKKSLRDKIVWSQHNLATDSVFTEVHLVVCRNVLIYFDKKLQNRVIGLFKDSLIRKGVLALGSKETLDYSSFKDDFTKLVSKEKIYRKVR